MAQEIASMQVSVLGFLGFLADDYPSETGKSSFFHRFFRLSIAICILASTSTWFLINWGQYITYLAMPSHQNLLVRIFLGLPFCMLVLRPLVILIIAFKQRSQLLYLLTVFRKISQLLPHKNRGASYSRWSFLLFWFPIIAPLCLFTWYFSAVMEFKPAMTLLTIVPMQIPWTITMPLWTSILIWMTVSVLGYFPSQQVIFLLVLYASAFKDILKAVNTDIHTTAIECNKTFLKHETIQRLQDRLDEWRRITLQVQKCCNKANAYYSILLFAFYGLDCITLLGFGANIIASVIPSVSAYAYYTMATLYFCMNITLFLSPLVAFHEEVCWSWFRARAELLYTKLHRQTGLLVDMNAK